MTVHTPVAKTVESEADCMVFYYIDLGLISDKRLIKYFVLIIMFFSTCLKQAVRLIYYFLYWVY